MLNSFAEIDIFAGPVGILPSWCMPKVNITIDPCYILASLILCASYQDSQPLIKPSCRKECDKVMMSALRLSRYIRSLAYMANKKERQTERNCVRAHVGFNTVHKLEREHK